MSALFNFHSFLTVVLLGICACTYVKMHFPALLEHRTGFRGFFWKAARIDSFIDDKVICIAWFLSIEFKGPLSHCHEKNYVAAPHAKADNL
ncbi:hypothetical protein Leryth_015726 [Lithospermum erythrorhizon]|nr:hypothetical protein Leryth_015726 [Lithospermum erythrorhizon]